MKNRDEISGDIDMGKFGKSQIIADQGVVLMVRALTLGWKQIIGYYVTRHSICVEMLTNTMLFVKQVYM